MFLEQHVSAATKHVVRADYILPNFHDVCDNSPELCIHTESTVKRVSRSSGKAQSEFSLEHED